jgi:hypothetical protein
VSRSVDQIIEYVEGLEDRAFSPTIKRVIVNRLNEQPTQEELDRAKAELYGT